MRDPGSPLRVAHVITSLVAGGTERQLERVVRATRPLGISHVVISLTDGGEVAEALRADGIEVHSLGMSRDDVMPDIGAVWRLRTLLAASRPDLVQAWMYHANLLASLASPLARTGRPVWGIRAASLPSGRERTRTIALANVTARLARALATSVIVNGERARRTHIAGGYPEHLMAVIPNGYDLGTWRPDVEARRSVRAELGLHDKTLLVGLIANFRPIKDHRTVLRAMAMLRHDGLPVHLLLAGVDASETSPALHTMIQQELGPGDGVSALGSRADVPRLTAALDIATLTSIDESFPNVVAEAMACGVPVIATDAGDVRIILGRDDDVVAVGDHVALANRIAWWLGQSQVTRAAHGRSLRQRIESHYSMASVAQQFAEHWRSLVNR